MSKGRVIALMILSMLSVFCGKDSVSASEYPRIATWKAHQVFAVAVSNDGRYVLSGGSDQTLRLWDLKLGVLGGYSPGHSDTITSAAFSPNDRQALSADGRDVRLWDIPGLKEMRSFGGNEGIAAAVVFSPDAKYAASGDGRTIKLWDLTKGEAIGSYKALSKEGSSIAFTLDSKLLIAGDQEEGKGYIRFWNVETGEQAKSIPLPGAYAAVSSFSPGGLYAIIEGPWVGSLWPKLWDMKEDRSIREFNQGTALSGRPASFYFPQAFSADSKYLLSGFGDVVLMVWDVSTGKGLSRLIGHREPIVSAALFKDAKRAVSGSIDGTTRLWNTFTGKEIAQLIGFKNGEWIIITAEGYYNASDKGDAQVVVEFEDGKEYPVATFRETFFRPDLVKLALSGGSLAKYKKIYDVARPPVKKPPK